MSCDRERAPVTISHLLVTVETASRDVKLPSPWEQSGKDRSREQKCMEWIAE